MVVSSPPSVRLGQTEPRLSTPPLRTLTRETSRGFEFAEFCDAFGLPLLPWQKWLAIHALELNPDGTYRFRVVLCLVGRQNGKTTVKRRITMWRMFLDGAQLILGVAQDVSLAREVWQATIDEIQSIPDLAAELDVVRRVNGDEWFRLTNGARYKIGASNRSAGRGLSLDELDFDELREQRSWDAWSALSKTTSARANSQIWAMSNAGDDQSVVLNQLRDAALAGRDPSIGIFEWSAPDGCELDDWDAIAQANPALGYTLSEQAIRTSLGTDPPEVFRTEVLCQRVDALDSAIDMGGWRAGRDATGTLDGLRDRVVVCVDVAPGGQHVVLAAGADLADGRVRVEAVKAWASTEDARDELPALLDDIGARAEAWFPGGPAAALAPVFRNRPNVVELTGRKVNEACMGLADLVVARRIVNPGDPLLDAHMAAASKQPSGDGWRFTRRGGGHVSGAYAVAGVVYLAQTVPVEQPKPRSMVF